METGRSQTRPQEFGISRFRRLAPRNVTPLPVVEPIIEINQRSEVITPTDIESKNLQVITNNTLETVSEIIPYIDINANSKEHDRELKLESWQIEWANKAHTILLSNHGYIDTSPTGSGKTYVALWLAKQFGLRLMVVCPLTIIEVWYRLAEQYGIEVVLIINYESLRSIKRHQPKHGLLTRYDEDTGRGTETSFVPTDDYLMLVQEGLLVIFDEIHEIKNKSGQYKACAALISPILTMGGHSRFGLLGATPIEKYDHAINFLYLIGFIRAHRLYTQRDGRLVLEGVQELIDACRYIDDNETRKVLREIPLVTSELKRLCFMLYVRVIKKVISGAMPEPTNKIGPFDAKNGFFNIPRYRIAELQEAISELSSIAGFNVRTGTSDVERVDFGKIRETMKHIEVAKVDTFARIAEQILKSNPHNKVVIALNFTNYSIPLVYNLLKHYDPLLLIGNTKSKDRLPIIDEFNNNPQRRLLIMNIAVGGVGTNLHDIQGDSPRFMLISPDYELVAVAQCTGRINRAGRKTAAVVRVVYGKGTGNIEMRVLNALVTKTEILKQVLEPEVLATLVLPGNYPLIYEAD